MKIDVTPGKYVAAVSGGVDSVVLLDLLSKLTDVEVIVAHFDHGIRSDSELDRIFVQGLAEKYGIDFDYKREELGVAASEALARERRYVFLKEVQKTHHCDGIITAHHLDDEIETAFLNLLRGTFRKGLSSLSGGEILRPLLTYSKEDLLTYAGQNNLTWHEDITNDDPRYLRNAIRIKLKKSNPKDKDKMINLIEEVKRRNEEMDLLVTDIFSYGADSGQDNIDRKFFVALPYKVSGEILAHWLRSKQLDFDKKNIELLQVGLKTGQFGNRYDVGSGYVFYLDDAQISLRRESSV